MIRGRLAGVVGEAPSFRDHGVGAGCKNDVGREPLPLENFVSFIRHRISAGHIDRESTRPLIIGYAAGFVRSDEDARGYYDRVEPSICEHDIFEHSSDTVA